MNRWLNIALWLLGISALVFLLAFEYAAERDVVFRALQIDVEQPAGQLFINREDIAQHLDAVDDSLYYRSISAINSSLLEESLENHPFIASAEVFSTLDGLVSVRVKQKEATARVITASRHHYLDAEGHPFPTTRSYSARVPVFTGNTDSTNIYQASILLQKIDQEPYFDGWLAEIHIVSNGNFELIPLAGKHRVIFGDTTNSTEKLRKLKAFYRTVVNANNLNDWKTLNLAYSNQLVSTKHNP
jgi:cell division protein FtsQ